MNIFNNIFHIFVNDGWESLTISHWDFHIGLPRTYTQWVKWQTELPLQFIFFYISSHPPGYIADFKYVKYTYDPALLLFFFWLIWSHILPIHSPQGCQSDLSKIEISCYSSASVAPHNQQHQVQKRGGERGVGEGRDRKEMSRGEGKEWQLCLYH